MIEFNTPFELTRVPRIIFGAGRFPKIPELVAGFGRQVLLVTGGSSLDQSGLWQQLVNDLSRRSIGWQRVRVPGEPTPELVDSAVAEFRHKKIDVVVGIGGGSVLDAAKAIAGLLLPGNSVMDHLEGVGRGVPYQGPATPYIAVPTTAGTGSEATKNAVLSRQGKSGFKKSFRDDALVAHTAVVDPRLLRALPLNLMAAQGMDAFTQLLESYLSRAATPITDALAWSGIEAFSQGFFTAIDADLRDDDSLAKVAYASLMSGITLAHAGLGSVHALAAPLGGYFPIPHGVACGTLLASAAEMNILLLQQQDPQGIALQKYANVASLLTAGNQKRDRLLEGLVEKLNEWLNVLEIPRLGSYGISESAIDLLVAGSRGGNMERNPAAMSDQNIAELLRSRL